MSFYTVEEKPNSRAAKEELKSKKSSRKQWLYVYVEEDHKIEPWVKDEARQLAGDYREEGIYEDRKYFLRKGGGKPPLALYWSTYAGGFDGGWYIAPTLGGTSLAWCVEDKEMPPQKGWVMRGRVPGFHVDTSLKIKMESIVMHEVHVCEYCVCAPVRCMTNLGECFAGGMVATFHGSADDVPQLEGRPRCTSCMQGMLNDMSCAVPISHAFEHAVDAWYQAMFVRGFCYMASYQKSITGAERGIKRTERDMHRARLKMMYHGYTSAIGEEMACHEPFVKALSDWMHISGTKTSENMRWAKNHPHAAAFAEETGCHIKFHDALEHLFDHTHKVSEARMKGNERKTDCLSALENTCLAGVLACFFCGGSKEAAKKPPPTIKTRSIEVKTTKPPPGTKEPEMAYTQASVEDTELNAAKAAKMKEMQATLEAEKQQASKLENEIRQIKEAEQMREMKLSEVEAAYAQRFQELETSNKTISAENESLQAQLMALKKKSSDWELREMGEQNEKSMLLGVHESQTKRIEELEAEINSQREFNSRHLAQISQMEESHTGKLQEMELANAQHAQHRQQLEMELAQRAQQEGMQEMRIKEVEAMYAQKMKEVESTYGQQIQAMTLEASQADGHHRNLKQQYEMATQQHDAEKARLRQQYETELGQAEQIRAAVEADCKNLAAQLDASGSQDVGQLREMEAEFQARTQQMEAQHIGEVQQLQMAVEAGNQRSAQLEQKILALEQATMSEEAMLQQQQADSMARTQELEEARIVIQELQSIQVKREEQMRELTQAHENKRLTLEAELAALTQQFNAQGASNDEYLRVTMEKQELEAVMEQERQNSAAQVAELETLLVQATDDANVLRAQLEEASAGKMEMRGLSQPTSPEPLSPGVTIAVVVERFVADSMDAAALSLEVGMQIEVLDVKGAWATVRIATGQTGDVPVMCLNMEGGSPETSVQYEAPMMVQSEPHLAQQVPVAAYDLPSTAPLQASAYPQAVEGVSAYATAPSTSTMTFGTSTIKYGSTKARVVPTSKVTGARPLTSVSTSVAAGTTTKYVGGPPSDRRWR